MKRLICLAAAMSLFSCGDDPQFTPRGEDAHILADRMNKLIEIWDLPASNTWNVVVRWEKGRPAFRDGGNSVRAAYCRINLHSKEIVVNRGIWETSTPGERDVRLIHEMGHCLYDLGHWSDKSLMDGDGKTPSGVYPTDISRFKKRIKDYTQVFPDSDDKINRASGKSPRAR